MKIASGLVIIGNAVTTNKLLLINKDGKWGFTGGLVPEKLLNCPEKEFYSLMLGSAIAHHHANTGLNPNRIEPKNFQHKNATPENLIVLDYVESEEIRLVHFLYKINCEMETYLEELVLPKPRYPINKIRFFSHMEIVAEASQNKLLPNVSKVVGKLQNYNLFF